MPNPKFLRYADLKPRGIPFARQHIRRLIDTRKFPEPVRIGANTIAWLESDIDDWLRERIEASPRRRRAVEAADQEVKMLGGGHARPAPRHSRQLPRSSLGSDRGGADSTDPQELGGGDGRPTT